MIGGLQGANAAIDQVDMLSVCADRLFSSPYGRSICPSQPSHSWLSNDVSYTQTQVLA